MAKGFVFYFKGEDIKTLASALQNPGDYVLITIGTAVGKNGDKKVAILNALAEAFSHPGAEKTATAFASKTVSVQGCPVPPCSPPK